MTISREIQDICAISAAIGQRRPNLSADDIAKAASKIYRISVSLQNRGVFKELIDRARGLARGLGCEFVLVDDPDSGAACWLDMRPAGALGEDTIRLV